MKGELAAFAAATLLSAVGAERYNSGEVKTYEEFLYGKFRTRMQGSGKKGTVSSFFTFWNGSEDLPWSEEHWNEIDVELVPSVEDAPFATNIIYSWRQMDTMKIPDFDPADNWHTYEIQWTPQYISWWLDEKEVRKVEGAAS